MKSKSKIEKELDQKELENSINRTLRNQELDREFEEKINRNYRPLELAAIKFFGNLFIGYMFFFIIRFFTRRFAVFGGEIVQGMLLILHILIWGIAVISLVTKKSPWDRFF